MGTHFTLFFSPFSAAITTFMPVFQISAALFFVTPTRMTPMIYRPMEHLLATKNGLIIFAELETALLI